MLFSSMTFVFLFLPILILIYFISKKEFHNMILLIASIIFYAWGEPKYLAIMLLTILINYFGAIAIEEFSSKKKLILTLTIILNLSFLIYFKYFNFLIEIFNDITHLNTSALNIIMPIGISFYTFQALSYLIDVYRKECSAQRNLYKLALYISLFPQLIAGPIVKYHDIAEQIDSREINFEKVNLGVKRFICGLAKKMLLANTMGAIADKIFVQAPDTFSHTIAWIGSIAYSLQLYFDFSGYSDMAIGLGLIFGFRFMENFNYPYISKSLTEFWRRWHISLSTWFKQYIYITIGGNKGSKIKTIRNLAVVFLLTGIWHGANWTFVLWGIYNGFFVIIEKIINIKEFEQKYTSRIVRVLQHIYCILIFVVGWVLFRSDSISYAKRYLMNMFGFMTPDSTKYMYEFTYYVDNCDIIIFIIAVLCAVPIFNKMIYTENKCLKAVVNVWLLFIFFLSAVTIASNTYNPFIYFRF